MQQNITHMESNKIRYHDTPTKQAIQADLDRPIELTRFPDQWAKSKKTMTISMRKLAKRIERTRAANKGKLPWLKMATFGNATSARGCYRTNANVATITGVEADYDAEQMSPEKARDRLAKANVAALVYTTPSHTPKAPHWRVLCPLSGPLPPDARIDLMARLNGALGGQLDPASFTLSQAYFAGNVTGGHPVKTYLVEGRYLDNATDLKPIYKDGGKIKPAPVISSGEKTGLPFAEIRDALMHIPNNDTNPKAESRDWWLAMLAALHHETDGGEDGLELAHEWSEQYADYDYEKTCKLWHSFRGEGRTGATILYEAREHGWINPAEIARQDALLDECWTPEELEAIAQEALDDQTRADIVELVGVPTKPLAKADWGSPMMRGDKPIINLFNTTAYLGRNLDSILPGLAHNQMTGRDEWKDGQLTDAAISIARIRQRKGGAYVPVPVGAPLKILLDSTPKTAVTILATTRKTAWTESGFRASWRTACKKAGVHDLTFHDLRGTAATRLAVAGCSVPEIATITGHKLKQVEAILDSHYLSRDSALGISAIQKLEAHEKRTKIPN